MEDADLSRKRAAPPAAEEDDEGSSAAKMRAVEDEETATMMAVISQHAEHRGPREVGLGVGVGVNGGSSAGSAKNNNDTLARRYVRGKSMREEGSKLSGQLAVAVQSGRLDVGSSYICHMCGEPGHHIRLCPQKHGRKLSKKIRAAPGIPRSWLRVISPAEVNDYNDVYHLASEFFPERKA